MPPSPRDQGGWFTSSYSNAGGSCVEVRFSQRAVSVRDSKARDDRHSVIQVSAAGWSSFLNFVVD
ncbi:DUF397 domain-containing protein [Umezawaea sp.]|uniref:DUF397 domain-containing protein n=1 Tax=Umezawaea sp. TaxID=1955258 RepID=UPI002ED0AF43